MITIRTILITGGLGFIGSHAAEIFASLGDRVICVDNLSRPQPNVLQEDILPYTWNFLDKNWPQIEKKKLDLRNYSELSELLEEIQPDVVIHAAGQTSAVGSIQFPQDDFENNVNGLFNTLELSRKIGTVSDFIYLSTNKVYGEKVNSCPITETDVRYIPMDNQFLGVDENFSIDQSEHAPYGISKLTGDLYVQEYGHLYGINTAVFRQSCIYGPRQFGFVEQGWISFLLIQAIKHHPITIYGNGKQVRDILYIDDLIRLFQEYLEWPQRQGSRVFNVGGGVHYSVSLLEVIDIIENLLDFPLQINYDQERPGDQKYYVSDITKITTEMNWKPLISPQVGIQQTLTWQTENQALFI